MPRRIRPRDTSEGPHTRGDDERRRWLSQWKQKAVEQLPSDTPRPLKVQLRAEVDRLLARFRPGDDEDEVRDVVDSAIEGTLKRLSSLAADQGHQVTKKTLIVLTPAFLKIALSRHDGRRVAEMLSQPESSRAVLIARLKRYLKRHLRGDEEHGDVQDLVDVWVARRLAKQRPAKRKSSRIAIGTATVVAAATGAVAYQHPAVKAVVGRSLAKARQLWEQLKPSSPAAAPSAQGQSDVAPDH